MNSQVKLQVMSRELGPQCHMIENDAHRRRKMKMIAHGPHNGSGVAIIDVYVLN